MRTKLIRLFCVQASASTATAFDKSGLIKGKSFDFSDVMNLADQAQVGDQVFAQLTGMAPFTMPWLFPYAPLEQFNFCGSTPIWKLKPSCAEHLYARSIPTLDAGFLT